MSSSSISSKQPGRGSRHGTPFVSPPALPSAPIIRDENMTEEQEKMAALAAEIAYAAMAINMTSDRAVWFDIVGHVNWITVRSSDSKTRFQNETFSGQADYRSCTSDITTYTPEAQLQLERLEALRDHLVAFARTGGEQLELDLHIPRGMSWRHGL
jgi:hypothetical protein